MDIIVGDLVNKIKEVFDSTKVLSVESVYEKIEGTQDLRLVISMNKILYDGFSTKVYKFFRILLLCATVA